MIPSRWVRTYKYKGGVVALCALRHLTVLHVRKLGNFRYILIPEIINTFMTNISEPVIAKHVLVFKLNLK
jgi:hypothetical protein